MGIPVGKKGTSLAARQAAQQELANNPEKYSKVQIIMVVLIHYVLIK